MVGLAITNEQKSYIAGFFDGEGCISFHIVGKNKKYRGGRGHCYSVVCNLTNNHIDALIHIQNLVGGKIYKKFKSKPAHSDGYILSFTSRESARDFLVTIKDYLIIKKKQADIAVEYLNRRLQKAPTSGTNIKIDEEEFQMIRGVRNLNSINNKRVVLI